MYEIFQSRLANPKDALGLPSVRNNRFSEFWALREMDLELRRGEHLGMIDSSSGQIDAAGAHHPEHRAHPGETISVDGRVQALVRDGRATPRIHGPREH